MQLTQTFVAATLALAGAASAKEIIVQVSNKDAALIYNKNDIRADVGDTVKFIFNPRNHTVTEAAFAAPCVPLQGGFNSGFRPTPADAPEVDTFTYRVGDDRPHWFYCAQTTGTHCQKGMVGVINPPQARPENNINSFAAAAARTNQTLPGIGITGGVLGKISREQAAAYLSAANPSWTPTLNGTAAPTGTLSLVTNTASATLTGAYESVYTNKEGQAQTTTISGAVTGWTQSVYSTAYTSTGVNGAIETGIAQITAQIPQFIATGGAAGFGQGAVAAAGGLAAGAALFAMM